MLTGVLVLTEVILELTGKDCVLRGGFGVDGGGFGAGEKDWVLSWGSFGVDGEGC